MASRKQIAAACASACILTAGFEGLVTHPNPDPHNPALQQVCYGDTEVEMRTYTPEECKMLLRARQQHDYAPPIAKCLPGIVNNRYIFGASIDAAYNGGAAAFCRSPMAAHFRSGDLIGGCNRFPYWHTLPGSNVHKGLLRRREAERSLCLEGTT